MDFFVKMCQEKKIWKLSDLNNVIETCIKVCEKSCMAANFCDLLG